MNSSLQGDTKNRMYHFFDDMINRKSWDVNEIKIMKSHKKYRYLP